MLNLRPTVLLLCTTLALGACAVAEEATVSCPFVNLGLPVGGSAQSTRPFERLPVLLKLRCLMGASGVVIETQLFPVHPPMFVTTQIQLFATADDYIIGSGVVLRGQNSCEIRLNLPHYLLRADSVELTVGAYDHTGVVLGEEELQVKLDPVLSVHASPVSVQPAKLQFPRVYPASVLPLDEGVCAITSHVFGLRTRSEVGMPGSNHCGNRFIFLVSASEGGLICSRAEAALSAVARHFRSRDANYGLFGVVDAVHSDDMLGPSLSPPAFFEVFDEGLPRQIKLSRSLAVMSVAAIVTELSQVVHHLLNDPLPLYFRAATSVTEAMDMTSHKHIIASIVARMRPLHYLEIGMHEGSQLQLVLPHVQGRCVGVDNVNRWEGKGALRKGTFEFFHMSSKEFCDLHIASLGLKYDVVFIDALHSHAASREEFECVWDFVQHDGIVFLHDTYPTNIAQTRLVYCGDAYATPLHLKETYGDQLEILTLPLPPGLTIVRKLPPGRHIHWNPFSDSSAHMLDEENCQQFSRLTEYGLSPQRSFQNFDGEP